VNIARKRGIPYINVIKRKTKTNVINEKAIIQEKDIGHRNRKSLCG